MKKRITTSEEFARARSLRELGLAFDGDEFERMRIESRMGSEPSGLSIVQNCSLPSEALDIPGGAGFAFQACIENISNQVLSPCTVLFDGPEWGCRMNLIPDPRRTEYPDLYFWDPRDYGYHRDTVLNNCIGTRHRLVPGEQLEGVILAVGDGAVPLNYGSYEKFQMGLTLFDQHGRAASCAFRLVIERGTNYKRIVEAAGKPKGRPRIFTPDLIAELEQQDDHADQGELVTARK